MIKKNGYFMTFGSNLPEKIKFKENQNSLETIILNRSELSELIIENLKYKRKDIAVEILNDKMLAKKHNNRLDFNLNPEKVLLKVLLEFNDHTLYSYNYENNTYFFIETAGNIEFLRYKKIKKNKKQIEVKDFRQQLLSKFNIPDSKNVGLIGGVKYKDIDLINYFLKYAKHNNFSYKKYDSFLARKLKDAFNITPQIGYYFMSQSTKTENGFFETSFKDSQISFGLDIEYFFNSEFKKRSLILTYMHYGKIDNEGDFKFAVPNDSEVSNTIQLSNVHLRFRQYFRLLNNQFLYANIGVLNSMSSGKTEYIFRETETYIADLEYENSFAFSIGFGYNYKNIYLDVNYIPSIGGAYNSLNFNATRADWEYRRSSLNVSIGYSVF